MKIENNLKKYRTQIEGLTQAKLALLVGVSETHYQNIEYGSTKPNVYLAQRIANALGKDVKDLFPLPIETSPKENFTPK